MSYTVPTDPADPCAAALELIVCLPEAVSPRAAVLRGMWQRIAAMLDAEGAFVDMSWFDARHACVAILCDAMTHDDVVERLQERARRAENGDDNMVWDDTAAMVRALRIAATVIAL